MLNRALRETYPPGSTFKVVTAAAALENGLYTDIDAQDGLPAALQLPPGTTTPLKNEGNIPCKNATLRDALRYSCNTVFGKIGADLGKDKMLDEAEKFGFNKEHLHPGPRRRQHLPQGHGPAAERAGRHRPVRHRATPLQMAMVASAVANDGKLMKPYMVDKLQAPEPRRDRAAHEPRADEPAAAPRRTPRSSSR